MISFASSGPPPNLEVQKDKFYFHFCCCFSQFLVSDDYQVEIHHRGYSRGSSPLHWVFLEKAREQRACLRAQCPREADVFHENELKQLLVILVVERQSAAHHLIHYHPQTPPVHSTAIVVVF